MMYLNYETLHKKYSQIKPITGVVHVGACTGEEREAYAACDVNNVIWFEANPVTYELLCQNIKSFKGNAAHNVLLSDVEGDVVNFYVTSNFRSASSSMLKLAKHAEHYPQIVVTETIKLTTRRFDEYMKDKSFEGCNFLNADVQGAELKVFRGLGEHIKKFDYVYSEVNTAHLYENCVLLNELTEFLDSVGFTMQEINMTPYEWGDAIFVKKELLK
jgi:FkbM family methyltransferase